MFITKELLREHGACRDGINTISRIFNNTNRVELDLVLWKWAVRNNFLYWGIMHLMDENIAQACVMYLYDRYHAIRRRGLDISPADSDFISWRYILSDLVCYGGYSEDIQMLVDIIND